MCSSPSSPTQRRAHKGMSLCWRGCPTWELHRNLKNTPIWRIFCVGGSFLSLPAPPPSSPSPEHTDTPIWCILCVQCFFSPSPAEHESTPHIFVLGNSLSISPNPILGDRHENGPIWGTFSCCFCSRNTPNTEAHLTWRVYGVLYNLFSHFSKLGNFSFW